jgi:hypothetical protein
VPGSLDELQKAMLLTVGLLDPRLETAEPKEFSVDLGFETITVWLS